ncbi:MAG: RNA ligase family protein [Clostridia bacterium]|nr:RNA ligase family protein [Clostridia bacterium]
MDYKILKYPRTQHLQGSRLGEGDEDLSQVPFSEILLKYIVIEEKIDGANSAISFNDQGDLLLQSRGHYLNGGYNERHYNLMKQWANNNKDLFYSVLGARYIMYGEWMYAKHTVFYDALPDYFMEFDIYDREKSIFLDTESRRKITEQLKIIHSVPVLSKGVFRSKEEILAYLGDSNYITENHMQVLQRLAERQGLDVERQMRETDPSLTMEGLYIKVEADGEVKQRVKFVRNSFYQCVNASGNHWQQRPIIPNQLATSKGKGNHE